MDARQEILPAARGFVSDVISALKKPEALSANRLMDTATCKDLMLTLHVLFQNELLPALDLLDRGLVTRLRLLRPHESLPLAYDFAQQGPSVIGDISARQRSPLLEANDATSDTNKDADDRDSATLSRGTYYVRSAQQQQSAHGTSRFRNAAYEDTTYYEVRLNAWSCSCPAFAFSAFPATLSDHQRDDKPLDRPLGSGDSPTWKFGGLSRGKDMPVCKHLLACVLVEHSSMFAHMVEERAVSPGEMAGWAAGWGD